MNNCSKNFLLVLLSFVILLSVAAGNAYATNGYFANGYSLESKGMAGAGVALPQGSLDAAINPAAMAFVGKRLDIGLTMFNPNREYKVEEILRVLVSVLLPGPCIAIPNGS